jgi:hypothetical protein
MNTLEAVRYKQRLDNLFKQISVFSGNIELQSQWARYLCVLVSGFLETAICAIYGEFARKTASPYVANYVKCELDSFQNPRMGRILELTRAFNPLWADELETATEGELKDAVNSVVANRNQIAHGRDVGITYISIKNYYEDVVKVVDLIENMCGS